MHVLGGNIAYIRTLNDCICISLPLYYLLFCDLGAVSALRWNVCPLSLCSFPRLRGTFYSCWYWLNWKFGRVAFFKIRLLSSCHVRPLHSEILPTYTHTQLLLEQGFVLDLFKCVSVCRFLATYCFLFLMQSWYRFLGTTSFVCVSLLCIAFAIYVCLLFEGWTVCFLAGPKVALIRH